MTDSQAISIPTEEDAVGAPVYMNLQFFKLAGGYRTLMSNEKVVAKQEFLSAYDRFLDEIPLAAYALYGLNSEADIMLWRVSPRLETFAKMSARILDAGLGKHLSPVRSYLGTVGGERYEQMPDPKRKIPGPIGITRYLSVTAIEPADGEKLLSCAGPAKERLHLLDGRGLGEHRMVAALEAVEASELQKLLAKLPGPVPGPTHTCLFGKIGDIIDGLG